ncbi:MAG: WD40 repeat domain-containing protein, partial [Polyangiaceae bacterium]
VTGLAWSRSGRRLATSSYGGVRLWNVEKGALDGELPWKGSLISLAWSPDEKVVAAGSQDCSVHFWRLATEQDSQMTGYTFKPRALAWDARSSLLATGGDATITAWDFSGSGPEGSAPLQLEGHKTLATHLAFSPRKAVLASASKDGSVLLWAPRRAKTPLAYGFLDDEVTGIAWHPEHRSLAAIDAGGNVLCWYPPG